MHYVGLHAITHCTYTKLVSYTASTNGMAHFDTVPYNAGDIGVNGGGTLLLLVRGVVVDVIDVIDEPEILRMFVDVFNEILPVFHAWFGVGDVSLSSLSGHDDDGKW